MSFADWSRLGQLLAVAALAIIAGLSFSMALGLRATLLPVVIGAVVPVFICSLLHERWRPSFAVALSISSVALAAVLFGFARLDPSVVAGGIINGWRRLLTAGVPAPADPDLVVVPLLVTWVAAFAGSELTVRTASALAPVAPSIAAYTFGLMFGVDGSAANQGVLAVIAMLVVAGVLVMMRVSYTVAGRAAGVPLNTSNRRIVVGTGIIVIFAVTGTYVGTVLPFGSSRSPFELRAFVQEPPELQTSLNPAAFIQKALNERDDPNSQPVFTVETSQDTEKSRYRLLVLDSYDGRAWSSAGQFLRAAPNLPPSPQVTIPTTTVKQTITIDRLTGYWLPMVDWPTKVRDRDVVFDRATGMVAVTGGLTPGRTIEIDSAEPRVAGQAEIPRTARFASGPAAQPYLQLPDQLTATLRAAASDGARAEFQFQSAVALEKYVSLDRGLQVAPKDRPRSGQSLADLDNLLTATAGGIGSPDQFAALYAVLGRAVGMPTRLVVGYGVAPGAGRHEVRSNDLQVWPEVLFEGIGWVGFDPVPGGQAKPDQKPPDDKPSLEETLKNAARPPASAADVGAPASGVAGRPADEGVLGVLRIALIVLLAGIAFLALWVVVLRFVRARRRHRRLAVTDARARIVGAWEEALDRLAEDGLRDSRAMTATDVVRVGVARLGPEAGQPLASLRTIVNQARYRAADPTAQQVDDAWSLATQFGARWNKTRSVGDRLRLLVDPRPLLARR